MAYRVYQFDGVMITDITRLPENGSNDMGSGNALTSFSQLPGGGFFDNYGANDSPQGIRPITRNCVLWGDTQDELITNLKTLRGKIGRRGRLTIQFDNGELWWQWARLQDVKMPRPRDAVGNYLPCNLSWVTASQQWYGLEQNGDTWSVGDDSFHLGDGAVSLGMNDYLYYFDAGNDTIAPTLTSDSNTIVRNMQIVLATDELLNELTVINQGHRLVWENPGYTGAFTLTIDTGSKSCLVRVHDDQISGSIQIFPRGNRALISASETHGLSSGDSVEIIGADDYTGIYHDIEVVTTSTFYIKFGETVPHATSVVPSGVYPLVDGWPNLTIYDRKNWLVLFPGDNDLLVQHDADEGTALQSRSIQFSWYDHYR